MNRFEPLIDVDMEGSVFEKLAEELKPGEKLASSVVLTALDDDGEADTFSELDLLALPWIFPIFPEPGEPVKPLCACAGRSSWSGMAIC